MISMFTDGACKANGKKNSHASYAFYFPEHKDWSFAAKVPLEEPQTNNRGELKAIHEGILVAMEKCGSPEEFTLHIYTDSAYSKDCLTSCRCMLYLGTHEIPCLLPGHRYLYRVRLSNTCCGVY